MSRNGLLLLAGWLMSGVALNHAPAALAGVLTFVFVMLGWVVALAVHEFGHAFVAWKAGDHTVEARGYLTFDPLRYADLGTSVILPVIVLVIGGIALPGGAVYLRPDLMRSPLWRSAASLAGPAGTLLALIVLAAALAVAGDSGGPLWPAVALLALFQAMALVFNLLPVPGLDGYGVIRPFLPAALQARLAPLEPLAIFALIAVVFFVPGASGLLWGAALGLTDLTGVDTDQIGRGLAAFRFWR
jgi:Zn-dependent protease